MSATIVVGVDESAASMRAVEFAAQEAALRNCRLRLLHACLYPGLHEQWTEPGTEPVDRLDTAMRQNAERARAIVPTLEVSTDVVIDDPVTALVKASHDAVALVVGSHGFAGFSELMVGSTAVELSAHAHCPVFVCRGRPEPEGPVVVGIDGVAESVVGFALSEASFRHTDLIALHAWNRWTSPIDMGFGDIPPGIYPGDALRDSEERILSEALAGWQQKFPDVTIHQQLVHQRTRQALLEASKSAGLLVVGNRGRGGFAGLLLGSTSHAMLHHAHCPVTIVRP